MPARLYLAIAAFVTTSGCATLESSQEAGTTQAPSSCGPRTYANRTELCAQWKAADAAVDAAFWARYSTVGGAISSVAVLIALFFAYRANHIATRSSERQLRAYIGYRKFYMNFHDNGQVDIQLTWYNSGQTPAYKADAICVLGYRSDELPAGFEFPLAVAGPPTQLTLSPQQEFNTLSHQLPRTHLNAIATGAMHLYVWSECTYIDAFDVHRFIRAAAKVNVVVVTPNQYRITFNNLSVFNEGN